MTKEPVRLAALAEDADTYVLDAEARGWSFEPDVALLDEPVSNLFWYHQAQRIRFDPAAGDRRIAQVRQWFLARGRTEWGWVVGPSATPTDLVDRLMATGAVLEDGGLSTAMVLEGEPPPSLRGVTVRRASGPLDLRVAEAVGAAAFGWSDDEIAELDASRDARWAAAAASGIVTFLAILDGEPAAVGSMEPLRGGAWMLFGGGTRPDAQDHGCYRALVRARWEHAVSEGGSGLVVDARSTSEPILARLGFEPVATIAHLIDRA